MFKNSNQIYTNPNYGIPDSNPRVAPKAPPWAMAADFCFDPERVAVPAT
jgi:hypothetical protein